MSLKNYFPASAHANKAEFDSLLDALHFHSDFFSYIAHAKSGRYFHVSPSFSVLTGYSVEEIEEKGVGFYVEHVPKEDTLKVMEQQALAFREVTEKGYDPELLNLIEMRSRIPRPEGNYILSIALCTALSYLPSGEIDFAIVTVYMESTDGTKNRQIRKEVVELLGQIKKLYWKIYTPKSFAWTEHKLTEIVFEVEPDHILTSKEKEVLKKIAQGKSTKEIAVELYISENTVETHRKNMLQKFEAKNIAELVKKTSKLY